MQICCLEDDIAHFKFADNRITATAGKYTYLCLTLPSMESDEGCEMTYFRLRYTAENYKDLFQKDYNGVTGIIVDGATSEKNLDYTIREPYTPSSFIIMSR